MKILRRPGIVTRHEILIQSWKKPLANCWSLSAVNHGSNSGARTGSSSYSIRAKCARQRPKMDHDRYSRPAPILIPPGPNVLSVANQNRFFFSAAMLCA